ncbi:MAG: hypothetical protein U9R28_10340, partial [Pseudomonadota bacterium]|nr:hypothetical protein [Pseudomonadota bacterium]
EFQIDDDDFWKFDIESLTDVEVLEYRSLIRTKGLTRTYRKRGKRGTLPFFIPRKRGTLPFFIPKINVILKLCLD